MSLDQYKKHIVIIAGESSGDLHGAHLVAALKEKDPFLEFSGLGGPKMQEAGVELDVDMMSLAVVGFVEVLKNYTQFKKIFNDILKKIAERKPAAVVLIDYPGFNLRLAKEIKKLGIKVIYYISPQVWAWKENRVEQVHEYIDRMMVLFEFEKTFYAKHNITVDFVGNPLLDEVIVSQSKDKFLKEIGFDDYKMTIGLLPGSREREVDNLLPIMLKTAAILKNEFPMLQFLIVRAPSIEHDQIRKHLDDVSLPLRIVDGNTYNSVNACDICIVASGTATLECALLEKPMAIIYKTSYITWALAKFFVKIKNIGLVNIVAQDRIVPEFLQSKANPILIASELKSIFTNEVAIAKMKAKLRTIRAALGSGGASQRAADVILEEID